jgi:CMP-N-acetylneuraminic acid synthetase
MIDFRNLYTLPKVYDQGNLGSCTAQSLGFAHHFLQIKQKYRRQDKEKYFARNGAAIYITKTKLLNKFILGGNILPYFMSSMDSVDIDNKYEETIK